MIGVFHTDLRVDIVFFPSGLACLYRYVGFYPCSQSIHISIFISSADSMIIQDKTDDPTIPATNKNLYRTRVPYFQSR